ncbi:hypothetical protein HY02_10075 [Peptococcaceae bacterium SCADC1_2_3]|nr:hypothetical protein DK28_0202895 [Peptococcaceae bacterium SCADC1_2_3]KFI37984.1 hypothetical protein HY02_10075 [Peptococcaceae bacterium SCADC1_2_3]
MKRTSTEVPAHFDLFVDSAGFIAVMNDRDPAHEKEIELWNLSIETGKLLVTSNFVIGETYTWMRYRKNPHIRQQAFSFLELLDQIQPPVLTIIQVSASVDKQTSKLLKKYRDLPLSYCDATSIVLADQFGVDQIFTFDQHFLAAGKVIKP